ncbi:MAG: TetR/AcrR family transcriptional regulator [Solirubrobacterales bacterium]|nr:TetR/AcrR family transcriptional regulator [Solirubrobacterales bacterium]
MGEAADSRPGRRRQADRSRESTQRLLDAAIELIAKKGYEGATAAEIGQHAGYSREMVRARYGSKDELIRSLWEREYFTYVHEPPSAGEAGLDHASRQLARVQTLAGEDPRHLRALLLLLFETAGSAHPWPREWTDHFENGLCDALDRGQTDGSVRADIDPRTEAEAAVALLLGRGLRWVVDPDRVDFAVEMTRLIARLRSSLAVVGAAA